MGRSRRGNGGLDPPGIARLLIFAMLKFSVRPLLEFWTPPPPEKIFGICAWLGHGAGSKMNSIDKFDKMESKPSLFMKCFTNLLGCISEQEYCFVNFEVWILFLLVNMNKNPSTT